MIVNVVYGFLGAGKTTFIKHILENPPPGEKLVILVNEFGDVGLDGLILSQAGNRMFDVVELPSGCICCTMAGDFRRQFLELHERYSPDRLIVEPTGVATISQIMQILKGEDLEPLYEELNLINILDASEFLTFIKRQRHFVENQLRHSTITILNKVDLVKENMVDLLVNSVKDISPNTTVFPTSFGCLDTALVHEILDTVAREPDAESTRGSGHSDGEHDLGHHHHEGLANQYKSFGKTFGEVFDQGCLEDFFERVKRGEFGEVVRAKGVFKTPDEWVKLELASNEVRFELIPAAVRSLVSLVGAEMNTQDMESELVNCQIK